MNKLLVAAVFCLAGLAYASHVYILPRPRCVWSLEIDSSMMFTRFKESIKVNGRYARMESTDYKGNVLSSMIARPDYARSLDEDEQSCAIFYYEPDSGCSVEFDDCSGGYSYEMVFSQYSWYRSHQSTPWKHIEKGKYGLRSCTIYYDDDINASALYVDNDGYPIAYIEDNHIPDSRQEMKFTFGSIAPMATFSFGSGDVYKCSDPRIFSIPSDTFARCSASTAKVAVSLVLSVVALAVLLI